MPWRRIRIAILLFVLATVAQTTWLARSRTAQWRTSLRVVIYPVNGDGSGTTARYISELRDTGFDAMEEFFSREVEKYRPPSLPPIDVFVAPAVATQPPAPPFGGNAPSVIFWSLRLRFWSYWNDRYEGPKPDVRLYVSYYDPALRDRLPHSTGLQKGLIGVVNVFAHAGMEGSNQFVIAHELLHTLGATDKYDPVSNQPLFPDGYADPDLQPLLPQKRAEIMGGRIPLSESRAETPQNMKQVVIGAKTAREINWVK